MSEEITNDDERNTGLQHMHGLGMPECMRRHVRWKTNVCASGLFLVPVYQISYSGASELLTLSVHKQALIRLFGRVEAAFVKVISQ